jgi:hypothetical protein
MFPVVIHPHESANYQAKKDGIKKTVKESYLSGVSGFFQLRTRPVPDCKKTMHGIAIIQKTFKQHLFFLKTWQSQVTYEENNHDMQKNKTMYIVYPGICGPDGSSRMP